MAIGADLREGKGGTHHDASRGGRFRKLLAKSPAARVPHSPPGGPPASGRAGDPERQEQGGRRRPPLLCSSLSPSTVAPGSLVSRAAPDREGQQWGRVGEGGGPHRRAAVAGEGSAAAP